MEKVVVKKDNVKLDEINKEVSEKLKELRSIKREVNFSKSLIEYKRVKKQIWKLDKKIKEEKNEKEISKLTSEKNKAEKEKESIIKKFKKVEIFERKVYSCKSKIESNIKSIDNRKNFIDFFIKKNEIKLMKLKELVDENKRSILIDKIEKDKLNIKSINKEIKIKLSKKQPVDIEKFEIDKLKIEIKESNKVLKEINILNSNESKKNEVNIKINSIENIMNEKQQISNEFQIILDQLLLLVNKVKEALSFIDADEVKDNTSFIVKYLNVWYGSKQALFDINFELPKNEVIAIIGPSGCGKSTFLKTLNRINDNIPSFKAKGRILLDGEFDIFKLKSIRNRYDKIELSTLRTKVGMIFQQPNPFPMSIYKNVIYGPKVRGIKNRAILSDIANTSLKDSGLYEEVKDNLKALGTSLSGGQQQRLCIARAIANEPEILLMDEPTSALDPIAAKNIEDLIIKLKEHYTIIMVTHSMQQAQRISDKTAFFYQGKLIEYGETEQIFERPKQKETKEYVSGKFG